MITLLDFVAAPLISGIGFFGSRADRKLGAEESINNDFGDYDAAGLTKKIAADFRPAIILPKSQPRA